MLKDPYKYFRVEARELLEGLGRAVLELERGEGGKDAVARILRLAHTLKGASRVVKQPGIAELAHSIEDAFEPCREGNTAIPREQITQVLGMLDVIAGKLPALDAPSVEPKGQARPPVSEEFFETVRVEIDEIDALLDGVSEASVQLTAFRREAEIVEHARQLASSLLEDVAPQHQAETNGAGRMDARAKARGIAEELRSHLERLGRSFASGIDLVESEFAQVRDAANRLRLLPAAALFASLERTARDAAQSLHKEVLFESAGGGNRMDAHVLTALRVALPHVVRNAVAHGIEAPQQRVALGKPAQGRVELRVERRGDRVAFICNDDGRGIDLEAVRHAAIRRGLLPASEASSFGMEHAVQIIMKGGVTTSGEVDEISGRGIGLDVVRETATRLNGEVLVRSEAGRGTSLEICVPVSLSSLTALEVEAGGTVVALPLDAIRQTMRVAVHEIARSADKESIVYQGRAIAFLPLSRALHKDAAPDLNRLFWSAVVLEARSGVAAVGVDRLLGTRNVVVRSLPSLSNAEAVVAGASLDAEGNPQLVLDPLGLVDAAYLGRAPTVSPPAAKPSLVLVIDDSLTTRMLEQSILESAGYEVDLATSGEEGLEKARAKAYGLFLVDVEMPGMDGFEFVTRTQGDTSLRAIPAILVTSKSGVEDRRRGEQVGARGYIVKGEFDQRHLLRLIHEFMD